jgi:hypothetical protein
MSVARALAGLAGYGLLVVGLAWFQVAVGRWARRFGDRGER